MLINDQVLNPKQTQLHFQIVKANHVLTKTDGFIHIVSTQQGFLQAEALLRCAILLFSGVPICHLYRQSKKMYL